MDFACRIGARKLGIAHCIGLTYEAGLARRIFLAGGFEVYTVCCKVGSVDFFAYDLVCLGFPSYQSSPREDYAAEGQRHCLCPYPIRWAAHPIRYTTPRRLEMTASLPQDLFRHVVNAFL